MGKSVVLKNNTNNQASPDSGAVVVGSHLESKGVNQTLYGQYNDNSGDAENDLVQIGGGTPNERANALRVDKNGNVTLMGGEIYMDTTVGSIVMRVPIYMEGIGKDASTTINKKVYL